MYAFITQLSIWAIPLMLSYVLVYAIYKKVPVYDSFIAGAKSGFGTAIKIMPHLVGMMVAITIFRESGALAWCLKVSSLFSPFFISREKCCRLRCFARLPVPARLPLRRI